MNILSRSRSSRHQDLREAAAKRHNVVADVHPEDFIFEYVLESPKFGDPESAVDYYFDDGARSAEKLATILNALGLPDRYRLLEFASGYGCVTRHFARALPQAIVTSCDIHPDAVNFIDSKIGTATLLSDPVPEQLSSSETYEVIFALSFFSHMPRSTWTRWLRALASMLSGGGVFIFTTHGHRSLSGFGGMPIGPDGFLFNPGSEQKDLDGAEYGSTLVTPAFVFNEAETLKDLGVRIIRFEEAGWWSHQDVYIMVRYPVV